MKQMKKEIVYHQLDDKHLTEDQSTLMAAAKEARSNAYAPYSNFQVGAAVLLDNGEIITGSNQENAAYPSGLCAERVALFAAHHQYPEAKVESIAIAASNQGKDLEEPIMPCGACIQVMSESIKRNGGGFGVMLYGKAHSYCIEDAQDLIPFRFDL